jgi:hypothetical protein
MKNTNSIFENSIFKRLNKKFSVIELASVKLVSVNEPLNRICSNFNNFFFYIFTDCGWREKCSKIIEVSFEMFETLTGKFAKNNPSRALARLAWGR